MNLKGKALASLCSLRHNVHNNKIMYSQCSESVVMMTTQVNGKAQNMTAHHDKTP